MRPGCPSSTSSVSPCGPSAWAGRTPTSSIPCISRSTTTTSLPKMHSKHGHTIHSAQHHFGWDNAFPPALTVAPGSTIKFECVDAGGGQITPESTVASVAALDFSRVNPVTGPVYVDGAEPGDALQVTIEGFEPSGFGWTALIPGFGLLADQFPDPALTLWKYDTSSMAPALFGKNARVPLKPFAGTIGLALAEPGPHSVVPPRRVGGNL